MGSFGGYFKGEKKKQKREVVEKRVEHLPKLQAIPQVEIIGKGKGKK